VDAALAAGQGQVVTASAPAPAAARDPAAPPAAPAAYAYAPGDIYPRTDRERELCDRAARPDWLYLGGLAVLDVGAVWLGTSDTVKFSSSVPVRTSGAALIGLTWGATLGGAWLALPKCSSRWLDTPPREGEVGASWPLAFAIALLAGATAPIVNGIAIGNLPVEWSTFEREMHVAVAAVFGFGGALVPYVLPPRTLSAARELEHIRIEPLLTGTLAPGAVAPASGLPRAASGLYLGYVGSF
jgi:hypothetical protein